jgi:hypothetical protein
VTRVLRTDVLDDEDLPLQLEKFASAAALNAGVSGWYWDQTTKVLWINLAGGDVHAQRSILRGMFFNTSGASRVLAQGAIVGFKDVRFEGVQFVELDSGGREHGVWLENCEVLWAPDKGVDATQCWRVVITNSFFYASLSDAVNGFAPSPALGQGLLLLARNRFVNSGDVSVFADDGSKQGVSAHGGVQHVGWGNVLDGNNGANIADTCLANWTDVTWLAGCRSITPALAASAGYEFGMAAVNASRKVYMDTCDSVDASTYDLKTNVNAVVRLFNSPMPSFTGTVPGAYVPNSPP